MPVKARDLRVGEYYQVGKHIRGILRITQINVLQATIYGDFMDIKTGGISNMGIKLAEIEAKMSVDRAYPYRRQFIKNLLDF